MIIDVLRDAQHLTGAFFQGDYAVELADTIRTLQLG